MTYVNDIDWNLAWKKPESGSGTSIRKMVSCSDRWSDPERCRKFSDSIRENDFAASKARISSIDFTPESRILDVGAGPGTLALPFSRMVSHVTAVEPSEGMRSCLRDGMEDLGSENITIVPKLWEDVDVRTDLTPPYDVVIASYSLGFPDLKEGLLKMAEASNRYVYIFWFADMISPWQRNYAEIWERLFGIPISEYRKPNIIFNLLHQMGIYANVEITREEMRQKFSSIEEAVADQGAGLNLETEEQCTILREYLMTRLQPEGGKLVMNSISHRAKIWWKKE
jgi:predicted RNA methylase